MERLGWLKSISYRNSFMNGTITWGYDWKTQSAWTSKQALVLDTNIIFYVQKKSLWFHFKTLEIEWFTWILEWIGMNLIVACRFSKLSRIGPLWPVGCLKKKWGAKCVMTITMNCSHSSSKQPASSPQTLEHFNTSICDHNSNWRNFRSTYDFKWKKYQAGCCTQLPSNMRYPKGTLLDTVDVDHCK